jgi:hypothetical protein
MTSRYLGAVEVAELTGMSKSYAFKLIQRLNSELRDQGVITIPGKVETAYFNRRMCSAFRPDIGGGSHVH